MSITHMQRVFRSTLPSHLRMVLIAIADGANDDGVCWPGQTKLADKCGLGDRALRKGLTQLVDMGYLVVDRKGNNRTNWYHVLIDDDGRPTGTTVPVGPGEGQEPQFRTDRNPSSGPDRNPSSGPIENPQIEPSVEPPSLAPAVLEVPAWAEHVRVFPVGRSGLTDCWEGADQDWRPCQAAHIWQRGAVRRDLLREAVDAEMPISNERERGRRAKAVSLLRESGVDPSEFATLRRVYLWKSDGKWADTDLAIAGRVADLRRWANDATEVNSRAAVNNRIEQEKQRRAHLKAIEAGPGVTAYDRIRRTP